MRDVITFGHAIADEMIVVALTSGVVALAANLVAFTMIDQKNQKTPEVFLGTGIKKKTPCPLLRQ